MAPKLVELDLGNNDLLDLPDSFIDAVLSHPTLAILDLTMNKYFGHLSLHDHPATQCTVHKLLSKLVVAASSSSLALRELCLEIIVLTEECCHPMLQQVLPLGPKGLVALHIRMNIPTIWPDFQSLSFIEPLVRIIAEKNRFIKHFAYF